MRVRVGGGILASFCGHVMLERKGAALVARAGPEAVHVNTQRMGVVHAHVLALLLAGGIVS